MPIKHTPTKTVDTLPPAEQADKDFAKNGNPADAVALAKSSNLSDNDSIVALFTPEEQNRLSKMIKHGEFTVREAAILKVLMSEAFNFEEIGVYLGVASTRTNGKPMSKIAAKKEVDRILKALQQKANIKGDMLVNLKKNMSAANREAAQKKADRKRAEKERARRQREATREFWKLLRELKATQREHGLPTSQYQKMFYAKPSNTISRDALTGGND